MSRIRPKTAEAVFQRDGAACRYCGVRVYHGLGNGHPYHASIDHVWPWALDGLNSHVNLVVACFTCNHDKDDARPTGRWKPLPVPDPPPAFTPWLGFTAGASRPIVDTNVERLDIPLVPRSERAAKNRKSAEERRARRREETGMPRRVRRLTGPSAPFCQNVGIDHLYYPDSWRCERCWWEDKPKV